MWKWHAKSFGWRTQEDNLNGAVPLCCFFTSFLGNIHSNSEYTMKKKMKTETCAERIQLSRSEKYICLAMVTTAPPGQNLLLTKLQSKQAGLPFAEEETGLCLKQVSNSAQWTCLRVLHHKYKSALSRITRHKTLFLFWKGLVSVPSLYPLAIRNSQTITALKSLDWYQDIVERLSERKLNNAIGVFAS